MTIKFNRAQEPCVYFLKKQLDKKMLPAWRRNNGIVMVLMRWHEEHPSAPAGTWCSSRRRFGCAAPAALTFEQRADARPDPVMSRSVTSST
jgi:hypothetical protein